MTLRKMSRPALFRFWCFTPNSVEAHFRTVRPLPFLYIGDIFAAVRDESANPVIRSTRSTIYDSGAGTDPANKQDDS